MGFRSPATLSLLVPLCVSACGGNDATPSPTQVPASFTMAGGGGQIIPPRTYPGPLPNPSSSNTCSASLFPSIVTCVNVQVGAPSALCRGGEYSCSQNRSGTCSQNGGVHCWVCPGPLCDPLTAANACSPASQRGTGLNALFPICHGHPLAERSVWRRQPYPPALRRITYAPSSTWNAKRRRRAVGPRK